jgi:hypothetical protein
MAAEQSQNLASSSRPAQGQTDARVVLHMNMKTKVLFKTRGGQTDAGVVLHLKSSPSSCFSIVNGTDFRDVYVWGLGFRT